MFSKFSVKKPYTVFVGVVLAVVLGIVSFTKMSTDLLPNISLPYVLVMTTYVGASPETVEMVVTKPVEASMATVSNIENISSVSSENYSMVIMEFSQSADMNAISLEIRESLDQLKSYWDDSVGNPVIMKLNPNMLPIMMVAVGHEGMDAVEISDYVNTTVIPRLESIEGVASASATGLVEESVHVVIQQEKIDAINEQVFGYIDGEMEDAQKEIDDGKKELADSEKELADSEKEMADAKQKIEDGKKELDEQKAELDKGKQQLDSEKNKITDELSKGMAALIDAKTKAQSGLTALEMQITQMKAQMEAAGLDMSDVATTLSNMKQMLENCNTYINKETLDETDYAMIQAIFGITGDEVTVRAALAMYAEKLQESITALETYQSLVSQKKKLESQIKTIDQSIADLTKGQMEASAGFGSADATINFGKVQLESAKSQLDASEDQITSGKDQIDAAKDQIADAKKQLEDAQTQLDDAKETAYLNADMNGILTVENVKALLTAQNFSMPAGFITEDSVEYLIRVGDKPDDVEKLKAMPLMNMNMEGVDIITLGDVADVFMTDNSDTMYTNVNGSAGVMIQFQKQTGYSTGDVSDKIEAEFKDMLEENADLTLLTLMDQGIFIDLVMDSIMSNIIFGGLLAILVLILFLKDVRPTLVIAISIPVSLVTAIACMYFSGVTLNIISLSGLALGIGMLVDNSIVVIENIYRLRNEGYSMKEAAIEGAREVGGAIVASTLTTVCVFAPIVFTEGITRQLFVDMGLTIAYSLLASLVVALTVVPALASKMLKTVKEAKDTGIFNRIARIYGKTIPFVLKWKIPVVILTVGLLFVSAAFAISKGIAFMPSMDTTQMSMTLAYPDDYTLEETGAKTDEIIEIIRGIDEVADVGAMVGGSDMSSLMGGSSNVTNQVSVYITLDEDKTHTGKEIAKMIEESTAGIEDVEMNITTEAMDMSALTGSGVSIQIKGRDLDTLMDISKDVAGIVEGVEGTTEVSDGIASTTGELRVLIDRDKAIEYGLTVAQVFAQVNAKITEDTGSTQLVTDTKEYDIFVIHQKNASMERTDIKNIMIDYTDKDKNPQKVALSEIAKFEDRAGVNSVNRDAQERYITVSAIVAEGYNIGPVTSDIKEALKDYKLPAGYKIVYSGENEMIMDAMEQMMLMMVLAIIFMFLIMVAQFQSLLSPFIIMFTIPLAFTGGFFGLYFTGSEVSVIALIGFVMLAGIIVNNGIVLVDYINQLRAEGMNKKDAIMEAGITRLRPVMMTALTTILAMSTMSFSDDMGADMSKPMAIVIIGGLIYGTLLTLYIVPCVYDLFNREKKKETVIEAFEVE